MPSKHEKEYRRQIQKELARKEKERFLNSLPMDQHLIFALFDHLDGQLEIKSCSHDYMMTIEFFNLQGIEASEQIVKWLQDNGGNCDCEITGVRVNHLFLPLYQPVCHAEVLRHLT